MDGRGTDTRHLVSLATSLLAALALYWALAIYWLRQSALVLPVVPLLVLLDRRNMCPFCHSGLALMSAVALCLAIGSCAVAFARPGAVFCRLIAHVSLGVYWVVCLKVLSR